MDYSAVRETLLQLFPCILVKSLKNPDGSCTTEGTTCGEPCVVPLPKTTFPLVRNHHYSGWNKQTGVCVLRAVQWHVQRCCCCCFCRVWQRESTAVVVPWRDWWVLTCRSYSWESRLVLDSRALHLCEQRSDYTVTYRSVRWPDFIFFNIYVVDFLPFLLHLSSFVLFFDHTILLFSGIFFYNIRQVDIFKLSDS